MEHAIVLEHLRHLIGLPLSIARRAANMRNFQFGPIRQLERGSIGTYALHIQCPWRLEGPSGLVTGFTDLWEPTEQSASIDPDTWSYDTHENVQDVALHQLLGSYDPTTRSAINQTKELVVEAVAADAYGSVQVALSGHYRLVLFPAGICGEQWRLFQPHSDAPHLVCDGMTISLHEEEE